MSDTRLMERLSLLMVGGLSSEEAHELRLRISTEPEVATMWSDLRRAEELVGELSIIDPPDGLKERLRSLDVPVVDSSYSPGTTTAPTWAHNLLLLVAAAVVVALITIAVWPDDEPNLQLVQGVQLVEGQADLVAAGVPVRVDGTASISVEPLPDTLRTTGQEDVMFEPKVLAAAITGVVLTVAVYEGTAWLFPDGDETVEIEAGELHTLEVDGGQMIPSTNPQRKSPKRDSSVSQGAALRALEANSSDKKDLEPSIVSVPSIEARSDDPGGDTATDPPPELVNDETGETVPRHAPNYDGINNAIGEELRSVRECYESWLAMEPDLQGKIVVSFTISEVDGNGAVIDVGVAGQTTDTNVMFEGCVLNIMSGLAFEAPPDGEDIQVEYPFAFSPG